MMERFIIVLIGGIGVGCMYGFVGLTFSAIFNCSKILNFALGDMAMLGALVGSALIFSGALPLPVGLLVVVAVPVAVGLAVNYIFAEPMIKRKASLAMTMMATVAAGFIISSITGLITNYSFFPTKLIFGSDPIILGLARISPQNVVIIITTLVLTLAYWLFLNKTRLGMGVKIAGFDADMAKLVGVNLSMVRLIAWLISGIITGLVGFLLAPLGLASAQMGFDLVFFGFIAAILGGLGNPLGALVGGLILGVTSSLFAAYVSGGYVQLVVFTMLLILLAVKPEGVLRSQ
jgi:branched-chain amino acid transport system permease protein